MAFDPTCTEPTSCARLPSAPSASRNEPRAESTAMLRGGCEEGWPGGMVQRTPPDAFRRRPVSDRFPKNTLCALDEIHAREEIAALEARRSPRSPSRARRFRPRSSRRACGWFRRSALAGSVAPITVRSAGRRLLARARAPRPGPRVMNVHELVEERPLAVHGIKPFGRARVSCTCCIARTLKPSSRRRCRMAPCLRYSTRVGLDDA